jgi:hypothetical protein
MHVYNTLILTRANFRDKNMTMYGLQKMEIYISLNSRNQIIAVSFPYFVIFM